MAKTKKKEKYLTKKDFELGFIAMNIHMLAKEYQTNKEFKKFIDDTYKKKVEELKKSKPSA